MLTQKSKAILTFFLISVLSYLIFFGRNLNPDLTLYSGKDATNFSYPTMFYLHEKLSEGEFPFWTERIFSGFPIYAQFESGYLNPINLFSTLVFGPIMANKILHFAFYLAGSYGLYLLIRKRDKSILSFVAANLIYFFSFLILYHQQHFSITKTFFIFPLLIYFTDSAYRTRKLKYVVFSILTLLSVVYFGSFQAVLIVIIGQLLYVLSLKPDKRFFFKYFIIYGLFSVFLSIPMIAPGIELIRESTRDEISFTEGSFNTLDLANFVYPFTYGSGDDYFGTSLFNDHFKHETYVYFGIAALLIAIASYSGSNKETKRFVNYVLLTTLILSFVRYVPVLNKFLFPPFSLFRYWGRLTVLIPFAAALLVSSGISKDKLKFDISLNRLKLPIIVISITAVNWLLNAEIKNILFTLKNNFRFDLNFAVWLALAVSTYVSIRSKNKNRKYILTLILCIDLIFFGIGVIRNDFIRVKDLKEELSVNENKRTQIVDSTHNYNKGLYYKDWGYLGYTPLASRDYVNTLKDLGFESEKLASENANVSQYNSLFPESPSYKISEVEQKEGSIKAVVIINNESVLRTNVRKYNDWKVYKNGESVQYQGDLFIEIPLEAGEHEIELKFVPTTLYNAMAISALLTSSGAAYLFKNKDVCNL